MCGKILEKNRHDGRYHHQDKGRIADVVEDPAPFLRSHLDIDLQPILPLDQLIMMALNLGNCKDFCKRYSLSYCG